MENPIEDVKKGTWTLISAGKMGPYGTAFTAGLFGFAAIFAPFEFLGGYLPENFNTFKQNLIPFALVGGLAVAVFISFNKSKDVISFKELAARISASIILVIVILSCISSLFPDQSKKVNELDARMVALQEDLKTTAHLSTTQAEEVVKIVYEAILSEELVTPEDLAHAPLSPEQRASVMQILEGKGYTTEADVISIIETREAYKATQVAAATATAQFTTCFLELNDKTVSVGVHILPDLKSENIDYMQTGDRLVALSRFGDEINVNVLWLVEIKHGENTKKGWVFSKSVVEVNEPACGLVPMWP